MTPRQFWATTITAVVVILAAAVAVAVATGQPERRLVEVELDDGRVVECIWWKAGRERGLECDFDNAKTPGEGAEK